ncbi:MAG: TetR/AcrR family transcriptional regulator [Christensenellales bacterium]
MEIQEMRQSFIDSAIRIVARDGMEKTTTKAIAAEAKLNEAYIYKCFSGKDELLSAALHMEDENFANLLQKTLPVMHMQGFSWKERAYILWKKSWDFILKEPADCIFYIRYYYSASCRIHAYETHLACFKPLIEKASKSFKPATNMDMLIHQIFSTMLFFASRVLGGELENSEETTAWAFEQIYSFVVPNVKDEVLEEEGRKGAL